MKDKVKIILNEDRVGSYTKDKIILELPPDIVERVFFIFREKSLKEDKDYLTQGKYREIADLFYDAFSKWEKERAEAGK